MTSMRSMMKALSLQSLKVTLDLLTWMILESKDFADYPKEPETKRTLLSNRLPLNYVSGTQGHSTWKNTKVWDSTRNNYSPIQPIDREIAKIGSSPDPTSMPKLDDELILNRSDPTDNRGKVKRVNSFEIAQERAASFLLKISKGGPVKSTGTKTQHRASTSNQAETSQTTTELHSMWKTGPPEKRLQ